MTVGLIIAFYNKEFLNGVNNAAVTGNGTKDNGRNNVDNLKNLKILTTKIRIFRTQISAAAAGSNCPQIHCRVI
jgi:hypothetical protein